MAQIEELFKAVGDGQSAIDLRYSVYIGAAESSTSGQKKIIKKRTSAALGLIALAVAAMFAEPGAAQPTVVPSGTIARGSATSTENAAALYPRAAIKVNNPASADRTQISLTWEVWAPVANVAVVMMAGHQEVMNQPNVTLTPASTGGFGSGPQTVELSSLANVGNAFVIGLNQVEVEVKIPNGVSSSALASFVLPGIYASIPIPPRAEQATYVVWRLVELIPQTPPDPSAVSISVGLAGQDIYPTAAATTTINNSYQKYFPDSAHRDLFGWFGDTGANAQSFLIPPVDPLHGAAGLALDAAGVPAAFTITATVTDTNAASAFPLSVGPFSVTVSPVVAGLIPQFPVTFSAETLLNQSGNRSMKTSISIHQDGQIIAQTVTHNGIQLTGYHGCVYIALYDQNSSDTDPPFYETASQSFGIDGAFIAGTSDRTDNWSAQITPPVTVNLIGNVVIAHYECPSDPHRDWNSWAAPLYSLIDEGAKVWNIYKGSSSGGGNGGNNVAGSSAQSSNSGSSSPSSSGSTPPSH